MTRPNCIIIGAGEGLGRALAAKFAREGFDIALISRSETGSAQAADAARAADARAHVRHHTADVTKPETLEAALADIQNQRGAIDCLIYNVRGSFTACAPLEMSYADLAEVYQLEVIGAFAAAKSVLPQMIARGQGAVFFSSATAAFRGSARHPLYAIGKFGLRALSQSLAKAHGPDGVHIAHVRLDCDLDVPVMHALYGEDAASAGLADPADVAESYWLTFQQPKGAWSNEVEIRPASERWTY